MKVACELWLGGSPCSGLHHKQTGYEKLGICALRIRHESDGRTQLLQWLDNQNRREVFFLQSGGPL